MTLKCANFPKCTGCSSWDTSYSEQKLNKISYLQSLLKANNLNFGDRPEFISCGEFGLRHRIDFTIEYSPETQLHTTGFYDQDKKLMTITECLQLDPKLQKIYSEFIKFKFFYGDNPLKKGSVRLRLSPSGQKGCWLDFSNIDIKHLLQDQKLLNELLNAGFIIEIGQKGKKLKRENGNLKLSEANPDTWFHTVDSTDKPITLKSLISDFTQPSWISAEALVKVVLTWIDGKQLKSVLEFGSGIGQFTLSFLKHGLTVDACDINSSAHERLLTNAQEHNLESRLKLHLGDFHRKPVPKNKAYDMVFVNPARSGLGHFTEQILKTEAECLIYVSCFPETLCSDLEKLKEKFEICNIIIIDQFPQTKHFETCVLLKKLN